jgi:hypothetical protein
LIKVFRRRIIAEKRLAATEEKSQIVSNHVERFGILLASEALKYCIVLYCIAVV